MDVASVIVWLATAVLGANLLLRTGALRGGPSGRSLRRRVTLTVHVVAAATGLALWAWFVFDDDRRFGAVAVLLLVTAAAHGLIMVVRWTPGFGRHATLARPQRRSGGYFPVHAAAIHAVAAGATLTLVVLTLFGTGS